LGISGATTRPCEISSVADARALVLDLSKGEFDAEARTLRAALAYIAGYLSKEESAVSRTACLIASAALDVANDRRLTSSHKATGAA